MTVRTEFRYLSEQDCIAAGVLDTNRCVEVIEEVFGILAQGDYLMGGSSHNSHGLGLVFPQTSPFPNMPTAGPDRRFVAMPGYLGGRFDVCGNKWYGSNHGNPSKGLPRSVLTVMLNNKDTGEPLALLSGNLISSARTGAVPGVAVRYLAKQNSRVVAVLGCGQINRACMKAILSQLPTVERVYCYDIFEAAAKNFAGWLQSNFGVEAFVTADLPSTVATADVVTACASRIQPLVVEDSWFAPGATVLISGPMRADDQFWINNRIVYDHIDLHKGYVEEANAAPNKHAYYDGLIGGPIYRLIDDGRLPDLDSSTDMGSIVLSRKGRRADEREKIVFIACGMSVFDLAWGYDLYQTALNTNLGTNLLLWAPPYSD